MEAAAICPAPRHLTPASAATDRLITEYLSTIFEDTRRYLGESDLPVTAYAHLHSTVILVSVLCDRVGMSGYLIHRLDEVSPTARLMQLITDLYHFDEPTQTVFSALRDPDASFMEIVNTFHFRHKLRVFERILRTK